MENYLSYLLSSLEKLETEEKEFCQCFVLKSKDEVIMKEVWHEEEENQEIKCPLHNDLSSKENIKRSEDKLDIRSFPKCVHLRKSGTVGNEYGVWSNMEVPKGVRFGPYEGITINEDEADQSGYSWKVLNDIWYSIDARDEHGCDWLHYVNFASTQEQQNLVALQYNGQIYYETIKDISPEMELLVWCGDDATDSGNETDDSPNVNQRKSLEKTIKLQLQDQSKQILLLDAENDDELLLLWCTKKHKKKVFHTHIDWEKYTPQNFKDNFRFRKQDAERLANALQLPEHISSPQRTKAAKMEALCLLLRRLSYQNRYCDLEQQFGRSEVELSYIFNSTLDLVYNMHCWKLRNLDWLSNDVLRDYSNAIQAKGSAFPHCWGFIGGTAVQICRPTYHQKHVFSGHKGYHALKFQSVVTPDGIIAHLYGTLEGKRQDIGMLMESGLYEELEERFSNNQIYYLYGDPGYISHPYLMAPFRGDCVTLEQKELNKNMSSLHQCVKWGFDKILQNFAFVDFQKNLKLHLQPVGKIYSVCAFLTNCHTCLYGNTTTEYFGLSPPSLENYINRYDK